MLTAPFRPNKLSKKLHLSSFFIRQSRISKHTKLAMTNKKHKSTIALVDCNNQKSLDTASLSKLKKELEPKVLTNYEEALDDAKNNRHDVYLLGDLGKGNDAYRFLHEAKKARCSSSIIALVNKEINEIVGKVPDKSRPLITHLALQSVNGKGYKDSIQRVIEESRRMRKRDNLAEIGNMFEKMHVMFYVERVKPNYFIEYLSPEWESIGYPRGYWYYENRSLFRTIMHPDDYEMMQEANRKIKEDPKIESDYEYRIYTKDGEMRWWRDQGRAICDRDGNFHKWIGVIYDITEKKNAEIALAESEEKYRNLIQNAHDIIFTHDLDGNIRSINQAVERITGFTVEEALGFNLRDIAASNHILRIEEMIETDFETEVSRNYEIEVFIKSGEKKSLEISSRIIHEDGEAAGVECIARDVTERKESERKLEYNALHDSLTGLPNRKHFMKHLELAIERRRIEPRYSFAVLFIDLDRFKIVNDSRGHYIGDKLLIEVSEILKSCVRPSDIIARLGGDEFTILVPIKEEPDAIRVAERLQEKLEVPFKIEGGEVFTSASVGIIIADDVDRDADAFLRDADSAMYGAKDSGKACYEIYDREMHKRNVNLLELETDLRQAIRQKEFRIFYQPIVDLRTGEVNEFEALIRWKHPKKGIVAPDEFIGIAEETGLIVPIGNWVLQESCRQIVEWEKDLNQKLTVNVNLSTKQLTDHYLVDKVNSVLRRFGLTADRLKLEITEHSVMENTDFALKTIRDLNAIGVRVSVDDFGTGHSSLSYLHMFPFERIKIDKSFVWEMDTDAKSEGILRSIMMLGKSLEIDVVAEGIENEEQLWRLRSIGCQHGQGYLFSKPIEAKKAGKLLSNGLSVDFSEIDMSLDLTEVNSNLSIDIKSIQ